MRPPMSSFLAFLILLQSATAHAYVPAHATNSSQAFLNRRSCTTDVSTLYLHSYSNGTTTHDIYHQLPRTQRRITSGALVHFSEAFVHESTPATYTPWIAMIPCDANATDASKEVDVFTLARDKGAKAALLYSSHSLSCIINPEYTDSPSGHALDIFLMQNPTNARSIKLRPRRVAPTTLYDPERLNNSGADINSTIAAGYPVSPGYVYAVLNVSDLTNTTTTPSVSNNGTGSSGTALAMIVLYAITGCVSALFCVVIISGAVRAIRHPERYGPRARFGDDGSPPQSRARGLTRAILDTFPVVKFGSASQETAGKDAEAQILDHNGTELKVRTLSEQNSINGLGDEGLPSAEQQTRDGYQVESETQLSLEDREHSLGTATIPDTSESASNTGIEHIQRRSRSEQSTNLAPSTSARNELMPEAIGTETCPICILDFEEGDNVRILPCEGQHRFHQTCVDPWLLELSSSCPICRHGKNIILGSYHELMSVRLSCFGNDVI
ncbi:hypothetical protein AX14_002319 [Amanita brunnescens Koide BX004]|nr:hypothetical protein AX14_002319 [Amanita brunnescens Koide BX004]